MLMPLSRVRSSRTQSMTLLPRATLYVSGFGLVVLPNRFVRLLYTVVGDPTPGKIVPLPSRHEMTDWLLLALPWTPLICMNSGSAAFLLTCSAAMWSIDRPVGFASNFPALLAELSVEFGVSG